MNEVKIQVSNEKALAATAEGGGTRIIRKSYVYENTYLKIDN